MEKVKTQQSKKPVSKIPLQRKKITEVSLSTGRSRVSRSLRPLSS
jgi:hypothetical protein